MSFYVNEVVMMERRMKQSNASEIATRLTHCIPLMNTEMFMFSFIHSYQQL